MGYQAEELFGEQIMHLYVISVSLVIYKLGSDSDLRCFWFTEQHVIVE